MLDSLNTKTINSWLCQLFIYVLTAFLVGCSQPEKLILAGPIMGTEYKITLTCLADQKVDKLKESEWHAEVLAVMEMVNQSMSTYIPDSEISLFNQSKSTEFQPISPAMLDVLSSAQRVSIETEGAFDVTVMPAVRIWGFGPGEKPLTLKLPEKAVLDTVSKSIGYNKLELAKSFDQWRKLHPEVQVDFSAIAKGYAVDKVSDKLLELGCENHLVDIGGELRATGQSTKDKLWRLAIEKPDSSGSFQAVIEAKNIAIASSGDYRNYYLLDGKRYSHTIDPRTLRPIEHNLAAVTVLDARAQRADAMATAFMVMGNKAVDFAEENNIPAYFIFRLPSNVSDADGAFQVLYTESFEKYLVTE